MRLAVALVAIFVVSSSVSAQIVYEPVKFQYFQGKYGYVYYYPGSDPAMKRFIHGDTNVNPHQIVTQDFRVYSDNLPRQNAAWQGYVVSDAYNEANQNLPGYYRKSDLLRAGRVDCTGALVVPAFAPGNSCGNSGSGSMEIKPYVRPATGPHPVIVIPKDMLDKPIHKPEDTGRKVASTN